MSVKPIPEGYQTITPHLSVKGAAAYVDFLKRAFGAQEMGVMPAPDGRIMHAQMRIGTSIIMFADRFPEYGGPTPVEGHWPLVLHMYVPDADKSFAKAVAAGCTVTMPLSDQFWGDRYGHVKDPFGFVWAIATHKEDVPREEMHKRQEAMFAQHK